MLKRILHDWHRYVLWALLSVLIWAWIFSLVTKAPASKKVQLFAELPAMRSEALEIALEREKPDGIAYVQAAQFDYAMIDQTEVLQGDLYLIPESKAEAYLASFAPIDRRLFPGASFYESQGKAEIVSKHIGLNKAIKYIVDRLDEEVPDEEYPFYVMYTYDKTNAYKLAEKLKEKGVEVTEDRIIPVGATVGAHIGPYACAVAYIKK